MVLIAGQNSVWQHTYRLSLLRAGAVNRIDEVFASAAGKGSNVARALALLGNESLLLAYVGGPNGRKFAAACARDGIRSDFTEIAGETRVCTTLIEDSHRITEIVEPSPPISAEERSSFRASFDRHIAEARLLAISGTAMVGESESCYLEFARSAHEHRIPVVLDSYRDHGRRALEAAPEVLKVNADELAELSKTECATFSQRAGAARVIRGQFGVQWIIVTRGGFGAEAFDAESSIVASTPEVPVKNAIGSGDAFTAGVISALLERTPARETGHRSRSGVPSDLAQALARGTAMGTANCMNLKPGEVLREHYEQVLSRIVISKRP